MLLVFSELYPSILFQSPWPYFNDAAASNCWNKVPWLGTFLSDQVQTLYSCLVYGIDQAQIEMLILALDCSQRK